jgi:hypothetical protein
MSTEDPNLTLKAWLRPAEGAPAAEVEPPESAAAELRARGVPKKLVRLLAKGRVLPIYKNSSDGRSLLVGFRRKNSSSRSAECWWLKVPLDAGGGAS